MKRFYRPELDCLRFGAFLLVFVHHSALSVDGPAFLRAGAYGVDLFFLLSAYLITELFRQEKTRTGGIDIPAFYWRRILRIWPLYFAFIGAILFAGEFAHQIRMPAPAAMSFLFFYANWYMGMHFLLSPAGAMWSVSIEEQFYACAPWAMRYLSFRGLLIGAGALIGVSAASRVLLFHAAISAWYATVTHLDPLAVGAIAALVLQGRVPVLPRSIRALLALAGLVSFVVGAVPLGGLAPPSVMAVSLSFPLTTVGSLALLLAFLGAKLDWGPVVYLGRISYGLYVFHLPALQLTKAVLLHTLGASPWGLRGGIALPITIGLAATSYRWLEAPFLRLKRLSKERAIPAL